MISHEYFMDKMRFYELYDILQFVPYADRAQWETTRFLSLVIAQKFCKKRLKLKDIFELPWDKKDQDFTEESIKHNEEVQQQLLNFLNKNTDTNNGSTIKNGINT